MAKLIFKRFRCQEGTSEIGLESPYFLTWVGNVRTNVSTLRYTRQAFWNNKVDEGPWWPVNETVSNGIDLAPNKSLALAIMIEKDGGADITKAEATDNVQNNGPKSVREKMAALLNTHFTNDSNIQDANVVSNFRLTFDQAVKDAMASTSGDDDDLMKPEVGAASQVIHLKSIPATLDAVKFRNDGDAVYWAEYQIV